VGDFLFNSLERSASREHIPLPDKCLLILTMKMGTGAKE